MKKLLYLFLAAALIWSCEKDEVLDFSNPQKPIVEKEELSNSILPEHLYAYAADDEADDTLSRTLVDNNKVLWHNGDNIFYCADNIIGAQYKFEGEDRTAKATFDKVGNGTVQENQAPFALGVFPFNNRFGVECNDETWTVTPFYEQEQNYVPNSFDKDANIMIAAGKDETDNNLYFRNACGYLVIKLYGLNVNIKSLWLIANDENLRLMGNKYNIVVGSDGELTFNENKFPEYNPYINRVFLDCGNEGVKISNDSANATEFWFALPPMTITDGIKIRVEDTHNNVILKETAKDIVIERNKVKRMQAFNVTNNTRTTRLWYKTATTDQNIPLEKFANKDEWGSYKYFDAKIIDHTWDYQNDNGHKMYYIEFDRPLTEIKKDAFKETGITEIILPEALTTIGESAFEGNKDLTSVTFQTVVSTIGKKAFYNNPNLKEVNFSESINTIGQGAFQYTGITNLTIPGSVTRIGPNAFSDCESLQKVTFQSSSEPLYIDGKGETDYGIEESPFYEATLQTLVLNRQLLPANDKVSMSLFRQHSELTSLTIGDEVETISDYMFASTGITSLSIPSSVTSINDGAFYRCEELVTVDVAGKVSIGYSAFNICEKLQTVDIRGGVTSIGIGAFGSCTSLNSFSMNATQSAGEIGSSAFSGCTALTTITIPGGITRIYDKVFYDCTSLNSISFLAGSQPLTMGYIPGMVAAYTADHGPFYHCPLTSISLDRDIVMSAEYADDCDANDEGIFSYQGYMGESHQTTVTIGENVTSIPTYMFATSAVTSVTIPSTITSVGQYAFLDCEKLQSAVINANLIGSDMFESCGNLATVTIGGTLDAINVDAFSGCSKLSTLNISGSVATIGDGAFDGFNLTSLNISGHVGTIGANAFDDNDKMTSFTVTGSVGTIGASAFEDSDALTTVSITGTVDRVCSYAFSDCDAVTTLAIRANTVEAYAYEDMDGLKTATLYGATVGSHVFYDCNSLQTLVIDGGVNSIGNNAFEECNSLSSVTFESGSQDLHIGFQDLSSDKGTFYDSPLTSISLDRELVYDYDDLDTWDEGIFATPNYDDDDPIVTVTLGSNVKTILPWMFSCVRMQNVNIPNSVTYIGKQAFSYCYILTEVSCRNTTPPTLGEDVFLNDKDEHNNNLTIKVPYTSNEYRTKWSQYAHCLNFVY